MRAGVIVRCESKYSEEFLGNQVRELSSLLGELEVLTLSDTEQIIAFTQEFDLETSCSKAEKLRLMTLSFDSKVIINTGIFSVTPIKLAVQLQAQVDRLTLTNKGEWDTSMWRPCAWRSLRPSACDSVSESNS